MYVCIFKVILDYNVIRYDLFIINKSQIKIYHTFYRNYILKVLYILNLFSIDNFVLKMN